MVQSVFQTDSLEQCVRPLHLLGRGSAIRQSGNQDVFQYRQLRQQVVVLKDEADRPIAEAGQFGFRQPIRVLAAQRDGAVRGRVQSADRVEQRALARSARTQDRQILAGAQLQRYVAQDAQGLAARRILFAHVVDRQVWH